MNRFPPAILATLLATATAQAQFFEARSAGMGGTGVASSHYWYAPLANPALLADHSDDATIGLLLPAVGAVVADSNDLIDAVDEFQTTVDGLQQTFNSGGIPTLQDRDQLIARLNALSNRPLTAKGGASIVIALPFEDFSVAFVTRSFLESEASVTVDPGDTNRILTATQALDIENLQTFGNARSALITDVGVSIAKSFDFGAFDLLVGITPKYQRVDTYNYVIDVNNYNEGDFTDERFRNDDAEFNADAGIALTFPLGLTIGAMIRDIDQKSYQTETIQGLSFNYNINPVVTVGAAWNSELMTVSAEVDINETERFDLQDESRLVRAGIELDLFSWTQIRAGATIDTENQQEDLLTLGFGFSPFDLVHIDIAGLVGDDKTYGLSIQTAFTF